MTMGDRIAVMRNGVVVQQGTPSTLYDDPVDVFVAQFVGASPMNLFGATLAIDDTEFVVGLGGCDLRLAVADTATSTRVAEVGGPAVVVGVRPESFVRLDDGPFVMDVAEVEWQGSHVLARGIVSVAATNARDPTQINSTLTGAYVNVIHDGDHAVDPIQPQHHDVDRSPVHRVDASTGRSKTAPPCDGGTPTNSA
jgi:multiple sugar transport system ATP-binding protein